MPHGHGTIALAALTLALAAPGPLSAQQRADAPVPALPRAAGVKARNVVFILLDTTRAAFRLVRSGVVRRYPGVKIILSHAGGFVPYASHRLAA